MGASLSSPIAGALPDLHAKALRTLTSRSPCPVSTYLLIRQTIATSDLLADDAEPVRRRFNAYYGVRRNANWRASFYAAFENAKLSTLPSTALFEAVLQALHADTGRVEASFVSKLVATLRPESPIIDSVVRGWLTHRLVAPPFGKGVDAAFAYYRWLEALMDQATTTGEARAWGAVFANRFPLAPGDEPVSATKQLDFLIWAGADR